MKVLLDTNIIIYREANRIVRQQIGTLFYWIDHLNYQKYIHPLSLDEIRKHKDPKVVEAFEAKAKSYYVLKTQAPSPRMILLKIVRIEMLSAKCIYPDPSIVR